MISTMSEEDRVKEVIVESRIQKVLSLRTDSIVMLEALDAISEFYTTNDAESRKNLRSNLEYQNIEYAKQFLQQMSVIKNKMDAAETLSNHLQNTCTTLAKRVQDADANMKSFIDKANALENQRIQLLQQSKELTEFLHRFHLSNEEISSLETCNLDHPHESKTFFQILNKIKSAYHDCQQLTQHQGYSVGFELLDILGKHQDTAYAQLYQWVKSKCEYLSERGQGEDLELNNRLQLSIAYLKDVKLYYAQCQDLLMGARRVQLLQKFMMVLTQGEGNQKYHRPLDLLSHDPVAYLSSILAYLHQLIAAEKEFIQAIFPSSSPPSTTSSGSQGPQGLSSDEMLVRCVVSLGKPLRVRLTHTLEGLGGAGGGVAGTGGGGIDTLYALLDLFSFYLSTFHKLVSIENALHSTLKGSLREGKRLFLKALEREREKMQAFSPPSDLRVSPVAREYIYSISSILKVYYVALSDCFEKNEGKGERSKGEQSHAEGEGETGKVDGGEGGGAEQGSDSFSIHHVLGEMISLLLQSCRKGGQGLGQGEMSVYMLNTITATQHELQTVTPPNPSSPSPSSPTALWSSLLSTESSLWRSLLVKGEVSRFFSRSQFDQVLDLLEVLPTGRKAAEQVGLEREKVERVSRAFYASLYSPLSWLYEKIQEAGMREEIRKEVGREIGDAHRKLYEIASDPAHGYDPSILQHSVEQVYLLLGGTSATSL